MIDLAQLYNLGLQANINIFDGIRLPEGSPLDRDVLINTIMERCGLNIPVYADPFVMASAVTVWSAKNQYTFIHIGKIYEAEYSPIENYNRIEESTEDKLHNIDEDSKGNSAKDEKTDSTAKSTIKDNKTSTHSGTDTTNEEHTTSAYNADSYQDDNNISSSITHGEQITDNGTGTNDTTGNSKKVTTGNSSNSRDLKETENNKTSIHTHGNIGVTTNTKMQTEEYELLKMFNPYNFIGEMFENDLTLYIY